MDGVDLESDVPKDLENKTDNNGIINIASLNIRGLSNKLQETLESFSLSEGEISVAINNGMNKRSVDIMGVMETWLRVGEPPPNQQPSSTSSFPYDWCETRTPAAATSLRGKGAIGVWCRTAGSPSGFTMIEAREHCMWIRIPGSTVTHVAFVYGVQEGEAKANKVLFWESLSSETLKYQALGDVIIMGDLNARLGLQIGDGDKQPNNNGHFLLNFVAQHQLSILNQMFAFGVATHFADRAASIDDDGPISHSSLSPSSSIIDYVLVPTASLHRVVDMCVVQHTIATDHAAVALKWIADFTHTPPPKQSTKRIRFRRPKDNDYSKYKVAVDISMNRWLLHYSSKCLAQYRSFSRDESSEFIEKIWMTFKKAVITAATNGLGLARRRNGTMRGWDEELAAIMKYKRWLDKEWKRLRMIAVVEGSPVSDFAAALAAKKEFIDYRKYAQLIVKKKKRNADQRLFAEIQTLSNETDKRQFFRIIKQMRGKGKYSALPTTMKDASTGITTTNEEETLTGWKNYFEKQGEANDLDPLFDFDFFSSVRSHFELTRDLAAAAHSSYVECAAVAADLESSISPPNVVVVNETGEGDEKVEGMVQMNETPTQASSAPSPSPPSAPSSPPSWPIARNEESAELNAPISVKEVEVALKLMKSGRATDPNDLYNELFTFGGPSMLVALHEVIARIWIHERIPYDWCSANIIPIYKNAGAKAAYSSYRGISLMSVAFKLYETILQKRLSDYIESNKLVGDEQGGFRQGRSTVDHIFVLSEIIAHRNEQSKPTYLCFLDLSKAYDLTWREGILDRLLSVGVHGKMWRVIADMYRLVKSKIIINGEPTEEFIMNVGVRQGSVLSPLLFSLFLSGVIDEWRARGLGVRISWSRSRARSRSRPGGGGSPSDLPDSDSMFGESRSIAGLLFADDIVLIADSIEHLQLALAIMEEHARKWRYKFNQSKCAVLCVGKHKPKASPTTSSFSLQSKPIAVSTSYKYLGVPITTSSRGGWNEWNEQSINKGKAGLPILWFCGARQSALPFLTAIRMIEIYLFPAMAYGSEVAAPAASSTISAELINNKINRLVLGSHSLRTNTACMRWELGALTIGARRDISKLRYLWRLQQMPNDLLTKEIYNIRFVTTTLRYIDNVATAASFDPLIVGHGAHQLLLKSRAKKPLRVSGWFKAMRGVVERYDLEDALSVDSLKGSKRPAWNKRIHSAVNTSLSNETKAAIRSSAQPTDGRPASVSAAFYLSLIDNNFKFNGEPAPYLLSSSMGYERSGRGRRYLSQLRLSTAPLAALQARHAIAPSLQPARFSTIQATSIPSSICSFCSSGSDEDQQHFLCECDAYSSDRLKLHDYLDNEWNHCAALRTAPEWYRLSVQRFDGVRSFHLLSLLQQCLWLLSTTKAEHCIAIESFIVSSFGVRDRLLKRRAQFATSHVLV
jgi:hypothetical protein